MEILTSLLTFGIWVLDPAESHPFMMEKEFLIDWVVMPVAASGPTSVLLDSGIVDLN